MKLIFGIGNPGERYRYTYHSLGVLLAEYCAFSLNFISKKQAAKYHLFKKDDNYILISKVFMNVSFTALREVYSYYKFNVQNILVLHDELGLKKFNFKIKRTEGLNGHNGLRDIAGNIGANFPRCMIGIDHPKNFNPAFKVSDYVLSKLIYEEWRPYFGLGLSLIEKWFMES